MEDLLEILEDLVSGVDFNTCTTLIDDHILTSLQIISLISDIEDEFDVAIPAVMVVPENFNSAQAIWNMIQKLMDEE